MNHERRYGEDEVRQVFARAAEAAEEEERASLPSRVDGGLTLGELQAVGLEVGLAPERVAAAAAELDASPQVVPRRKLLGAPISAGRIVDLPRELTDREWQFLVAELRATFDAKGEVTAEGGIREWSNGNLHAVLEQTEAGHRLRLGTRKGDALETTFVGVMFCVMAVIVAFIMVADGRVGAGLMVPTLMGLGGGGVLVANALRLPGGRASASGRWSTSRPGRRTCSPPLRRAPRRCRMRKVLVVAALGLLAAPAGILGQGGLDVIVRDADTGAGLPRAQVTLPGLGYGGITDVEGRFRMPGLPSGPVAVEVRLLGYAIARREATVVDDSVAVLEVPLTPTVISVAGLVAVGSRSRPRTATESMVPIDALAPSELLDQGDTDIDDLLRTTIPSYNVNPQAVGDAARIIRPANLRGLAPDHTLVLVNGKRRHRAAVITWIGNGVADGAQGPDISTIPAIALRQVEVLRDGASAQYGSDAIAGVMNFHLKDARSGGALEVRGGGFGDGGGEGYTISGNTGLPLGATGFANLSAEYGHSNSSSRSVQRADAALLVSRGNTHVRDPAQIWGAPKVEDDLKLWGNFGYFLGSGTKAYAHANYASQRVTGGFFYRNPNTRSGVFSLDAGETLLVGDLLDAQDGVLDGSAGCPVVRVTDGLPDPAALQHVLADPNCFTFQKLFPGGFTPQFGGDVSDASLVAGVGGPDRAPPMGRERELRPARSGLLHLQHRQRLAGPGHAHRVRSGTLPAGGHQPEPRRGVHRERPARPGGGGRVA